MRVVPGASARYGSFLERGVVMMPSYVNIGAHVGAQHDGRHLGHGRLVRPDRRQRAPLGRRRHRRRARAAAGRAGDGRGRLLHRQPLHRRRGRPRRARQRARCRRASSPARSRSSTPRPAPRSAGARCRRAASPSSATRPRRFGSHEFGLPCVLVIKHLARGRAPRQEPAQRHPPAITAPRCRDRPAPADRRAGRHPVGELPRAGPHRSPRGRAARPRAVARRSTGSATTWWPGRSSAEPNAWSWPATPTRCRPTATRPPGSRATAVGAGRRPT